MRAAKWLLSIITLTFALNVLASELTDRIRAVIPDRITVQSIDEHDAYVEINGTAAANQEISALMRAVDQAGLGDPQLESIRRENGVSRFQVRVVPH